MNVKKRVSYGKRKVTKSTKSTKGTKGTKKTGSKNILKSNYSVLVKGKMKAPSFISTLKGVSGKTRNDKLANLRRVLSTCKKKRISLLKKNGTGFKSYRTLVSQCGVTFKTPTSTSILNEKPGKLARNKGVYRVLRQYDLYRGRKAMARYKLRRNTPDELMVGPLAMVPYRRPSNRFGLWRFTDNSEEHIATYEKERQRRKDRARAEMSKREQNRELRGPIGARLWYRNFLNKKIEEETPVSWERPTRAYYNIELERINKEIDALNISDKTEKKLKDYIEKIRNKVKK